MAGLLNPVALILLGALVSLGVGGRPGLAALGRRLSGPAVVTAVAVLTVGHVAARVVIGLVAPGDFAGEIAAARAWQHGAPVYSADIATDSRVLVDAPPDGVGLVVDAQLPDDVRRFVISRRHTRLVAQAHPPTLLAVSVPLVTATGPSAAFLFWAAGTLVAAAWIGWRLAIVWHDHPSVALAVCLVAGWQPVLASIRDGQPGVVLAALAFGAWHAARRGLDGPAGAFAGIAAGLKLYPALVLLAFRRRPLPTLGFAVFGAAVPAAAATAVFGSAIWGAYAAAAASVVRGHWHAYSNLSILARVGQVAGPAAAAVVWLACAVVLVVMTIVASRRSGAHDALEGFDRSFAALCCLAVVLSPVSWHHYAVLLALPIGVAGRVAWASTGVAGPWIVLASALMLALPATETSGTAFVLPAAALLRTGAVLALWAWLLAAPWPSPLDS